MESLLAKSLGRLLSNIRDLNLVEIESAIGFDPSTSRNFAAEIVREINAGSAHRAEFPKAVLLVSRDAYRQAEVDFPDLKVVNPTSVLRYRFGDRIVVQTCDVISASVKQSFRLGVSREFPYPHEGSHLKQHQLLSELAKNSLAVVLEQSGSLLDVEGFLRDHDWISHSLTQVFEMLRASYERLDRAQSVLKPEIVPQALWINHVDEGLHNLQHRVIERKLLDGNHSTLGGFFDSGLWAAFSLPRPDNLNTRQYHPRNFNRHWEVFRDRWSTSELVSATLSDIAICQRKGLDDPHPIEHLEWRDLDRFAENTDFRAVGPLFATTQVDLASTRRHELFAQFSERNYFGPWLPPETDESEVLITMALRHLDGAPLAASSVLGDTKFIETSVRPQAQELSTPEFEIVLSGNASPDTLKRATSGASVRLLDEDGLFQLSHSSFEQDSQSGEMVAQARIYRSVKEQISFTNPVLSVQVVYGVGIGDNSRKWTKPQRIIVTPPDGAMLYCSETSSVRRVATSIRWVGSGKFDLSGAAGDGKEFELELRSDRRHGLVLWVKSAAEAASFNGTPLERLNSTERLWSIESFRLEEDSLVVADTFRFRLRVDETVGDPVHSPIIGAIEKRSVSLNPPESQLESLRGDIESLFGVLLTKEGSQPSILHAVLPVDVPDARVAISAVTFTTNESFIVPDVREFESTTNLRRMFERVPQELVASPEAAEFVSAFSDLGLVGELRKQRDSGGVAWMSRVSVRHLHETDRLTRYMEGYVALVARANEIGDPWGQFWASYPFATSVWTTTPVPKCSTVLLTPFHPIRLGWLASVEALLSPVSTKRARRLALGIEGWNLPMFGPSEVPGVKCLAVPTDPGADYEFAGWSQLLRCDGGVNAHSEVCGRRMPSSSAIAISESSVQSAFSVFRRIHPYLSSLRVDLADEKPVNRAAGVDRQVLNAAVDDGLSLEVFDSVLREGEIPQFPSDFGGKSRVTWRRYDPAVRSEKPTRVHVRVLQDPNISVRLDPSNPARGHRRGVIGSAPLRRFVVARGGDTADAGIESYLDPSLHSDHLTSPFVAALIAIELSGNQPQVQSVAVQLPISGGLVGNSFLTVFGESHISPSAVARLFRQNQENPMMIWEWSAPFRSDIRNFGNRSVIDARSHYSIAKVPQRFKEEVQTLLGSLYRDQPSMSHVDNLLGVLGTRGVSLANLLASGETQALSALGFYVAYELADCVWDPDAPLFVLPLDICQGFISTLLDRRPDEFSGKRSDLVVMRLAADSISFRVVELKYIGAKSPFARLPEVGSAEPNLQKGREQLRDVNELFEAILIEWDQLRATAADSNSSQHERDAARFELGLMGNALAMLLEAGMKTNPNGSGGYELALKGLENLANSRCDLVLEPPLLLGLYSLTESDSHARVGRTQAGESLGITEFIADPRALYSQIQTRSGPAYDSWVNLFASSSSSEQTAPISDLSDSGASTDGHYTPQMDETGSSTMSSANSDNKPNEAERANHLDSRGDDQANEELTDSAGPKESKSSVTAPVVVGEAVQDTPVVGDGIRVGVGQRLTVPKGPLVDFWPSNTRLNQFNLGVVGDLGTGKTQLLQGLVYQIRKQASTQQQTPISGLILDYKRDYQTDRFLGAVGGRSLEPVNLPLDLFRVESVGGSRALRVCQQRAREFADVVGKIYSIGGKQRNTLTKVVRELIQTERLSPTMAQVHEAYMHAVDQEPDLVSSVLESFVYGEVFSENPGEMKTMAELLDDGIVVLNLSALGADQQLKNALVALFLNEYYSYMLKLRKWKPTNVGGNQLRIINSILLVDEATNIMQYEFDVLTQILQQGREFGVGVMLSSQYLSHFDTTNVNYKEPLRTWFIHKVPQVKQRELQSIGVPTATAEDAARVSSLEPHEVYFVSLDFNGVFVRGKPFFEMLESEQDVSLT